MAPKKEVWQRSKKWEKSEEDYKDFGSDQSCRSKPHTLEKVLNSPEWKGSEVALNDGVYTLFHPSGAVCRLGMDIRERDKEGRILSPIPQGIDEKGKPCNWKRVEISQPFGTLELGAL